MNEKKDIEIVYSDEVKKDMKADPKKAAAMIEISAILRQAMAGVETGQYKSFEEAIEILTGSKPVRVDPDEEESDK